MHAPADWLPQPPVKRLKHGRLHDRDRVNWKSHGGPEKGDVVRKLTAPIRIGGYNVMITKDDLEFPVETDEGRRAAHKPRALKKA